MDRVAYRERILVVDAVAEARERLIASFVAAGYKAEGAETFGAAIGYLIVHPDCHLVFSDLGSDSAGSLALLDALAHDHPEVVAILTTERIEAELSIEAFRRGASDILRAPVSEATLMPAVERALEQSRLRRQMLLYRNNMEQLVGRRTSELRTTMTNLEQSYDITLEAMGDALDLRDEETEGHSKRVTAYTIALARAMRLSTHDLKTIARGAFLHDIGKIAIPDAILLKPGRLTEEEAVIMRTHCERGYAMVRKIPYLSEAAEIVRAHQESFNGSGYPRGLRGSEIPLGARIFAIADTLDAITSDRPYRKGNTFPAALEEIGRCSGTQFDPEIVEAFLALPPMTWPVIRAEIGRNCHAAELVRAAAA